MDHVAVAAQRAGRVAGAKLQSAVDHAQREGYFEPLCTERHLQVRHYTWDAFRYAGDIMHLLALGLCIVVILVKTGDNSQAEVGVSFKTHLLFFMVFSARFTNIFFCEQSVFLVLYKVLLWTATLKIIILMWTLGASDDKRDTLPLSAVLLPTFVITMVFGVYSVADHGLLVEFSWIFSTYLESVAMLPQFIYCYRDGDNRSVIVAAYVLAMGGYRTIFGISWGYHFLVMPYYLDMSSFISGMLGIGFFVDYLLFKIVRKSMLSSVCIGMDDTIREAEATLEEEVQRMVSEAVIPTALPPSPPALLPGAARVGLPVAERVGRPSEVELTPEVQYHDATNAR